MFNQKHGTEKGYPRPSTNDKEGEYSYIFTECGNRWYSVRTNPMDRDRCVCPKCGKTILVQEPDPKWWS